MLLQLVPSGQESVDSGMHLDFRVDDVAQAATEIEAIGGRVVKPPAFYSPEDSEDGSDMLEWAIMRDPFGNEFCIIRYPLE